MRTILACGSRGWRDRSCVHLVMLCEPHHQGWDDEPIRVIHGDCRGADRMAAESAKDLGYDVQAFPADWDTHGKRAGILRNLAMLDEKPDLVIAFGTGRGTEHTVTEATLRGIPVRRFGWSEDTLPLHFDTETLRLNQNQPEDTR